MGRLKDALAATGERLNDTLYANPLVTRFSSDSPARTKVDHDSVLHVTVDGFLELYRSKPWDDFLLRLPQHSRTFDFLALRSPQQNWVKGFLQLIFKYRRELWERSHWLPLSQLHEQDLLRRKSMAVTQREATEALFWIRVYQNRKTRQKNFTHELKKCFLVLHRDHARELSRCFCFDPCFPLVGVSASQVMHWNPASKDLLGDLVRIDDASPERNHWEYYPGGHPFYRHKLARWYQSVYPLPSDAYPKEWWDALNKLEMGARSPLMVVTASPRITGLNYKGGLAYVAHQRIDKVGHKRAALLPQLADDESDIYTKMHADVFQSGENTQTE